ncbi:MAG: phytanoyl-CoA dioxygenase family protein [Myxococcales bacterium]|nr:phytanoyl-CoA dioxygenase family protein [Myxococcales bacterium]
MPLEAALANYETQGWARLGPVFDPDYLAALRERADRIMLGEIVHDGLFFQHDAATGRYDDLPRGLGWQGPSLRYRKIEKLEKDPVFRAVLENALFERIARARIDGGIVLYRAVLFTKAAAGGTELPWHQDGGSFWGLSRDPSLQIWSALDDTPVEAGCVEVIPGSHKHGLATPLGGVIPDDVAARHDAAARAVPLPAKAGECLLIHNHLWHRSGINRTGRPRRAFTVCLMSEAIRCTRRKRAARTFLPLFRRKGVTLG